MIEAPKGVNLPPGVTIAATRETSQVGANGQIQQGLAWTLRLPDTTQTTVFIPYAIMASTAAVAMAFNERISQIYDVQNLVNPS